MNRRELVIAVAVSLALGAGVIIALGGSSIFTLGRATEVPPGVATYAAEPLKESTAPSPTPMSTSSPTRVPPAPTSTSIPTEVPPTPTPTLIPLDVGSEKGEDLEDVLLLYDSTRASNFDTNLCRIAEYYGLLCKRIALDATDLTDELLRDAQGDYFKLVGIGADTLLQSQPPHRRQNRPPHRRRSRPQHRSQRCRLRSQPRSRRRRDARCNGDVYSSFRCTHAYDGNCQASPGKPSLRALLPTTMAPAV